MNLTQLAEKVENVEELEKLRQQFQISAEDHMTNREASERVDLKTEVRIVPR